MLGVPLGSDGFVSEFVEKKLLGRLQNTVNKLVDFEDSQAALYLLRVSYSIVRAVHFMRTTPLPQWHEQAVKFDGMIRQASEDILGFSMTDETFAQACLTPTLGGLGLRKSVEHADLAFSASWHESRRQSGETWVPLPQVSEEYTSQKEASYEFDKTMLAHLIDQAPNDREVQRLLRASQPHACGFLAAVPSNEDGRDTIMRPRNFRTSVAYRLGVPLLPEEIPCPMCTQPINKFGDHATCCTRKGDLIVRHNTLRNFVFNVAVAGMFSPVLEKKGILGPTSGRRPGDVTIPNWSGGKALAIDVAVTSPLTVSSVRLIEPCEEYAASQKHRKYDSSFEGTDHLFSAMVFETLGAISQEGEEVLRQLFRRAAHHLGMEFSSFCGRAWARLSCNLQRAVSQSILNRIDGRSNPYEASAEVPESSGVDEPEGEEKEREGGGKEMSVVSSVSSGSCITPRHINNTQGGWSGRRGSKNRPDNNIFSPSSPSPSSRSRSSRRRSASLTSLPSPPLHTPHPSSQTRNI
jgi:hypothetical protein